eukprot:scaffold123426_cov31-Tisochrysis_lutea.AAC.1
MYSEINGGGSSGAPSVLSATFGAWSSRLSPSVPRVLSTVQRTEGYTLSMDCRRPRRSVPGGRVSRAHSRPALTEKRTASPSRVSEWRSRELSRRALAEIAAGGAAGAGQSQRVRLAQPIEMAAAPAIGRNSRRAAASQQQRRSARQRDAIASPRGRRRGGERALSLLSRPF